MSTFAWLFPSLVAILAIMRCFALEKKLRWSERRRANLSRIVNKLSAGGF